MNMPGFAAEASLYRTGGHYKTAGRATNSPTQMAGVIRPAMINDDVIEVFGCAPGAIQFGEGRNTICVSPFGLGNPFRTFGLGGHAITVGGRRRGTPREPPGFPVDDNDDDVGGTRKMDKACKDAAVGCFPLSTHIADCARLRCQKNYCSGNTCTEDEVRKGKKAKAEYDGALCDLAPCVRR